MNIVEKALDITSQLKSTVYLKDYITQQVGI